MTFFQCNTCPNRCTSTCARHLAMYTAQLCTLPACTGVLHFITFFHQFNELRELGRYALYDSFLQLGQLDKASSQPKKKKKMGAQVRAWRMAAASGRTDAARAAALRASSSARRRASASAAALAWACVETAIRASISLSKRHVTSKMPKDSMSASLCLGTFRAGPSIPKITPRQCKAAQVLLLLQRSLYQSPNQPLLALHTLTLARSGKPA